MKTVILDKTTSSYICPICGKGVTLHIDLPTIYHKKLDRIYAECPSLRGTDKHWYGEEAEEGRYDLIVIINLRPIDRLFEKYEKV